MSGSFSILASPIATGGAVILNIEGENGAGVLGLTLERSADGGATWMQIYAGVYTNLYLDTGDGTPDTLSVSGSFTYKVSDTGTPTISATSEAVTPLSQITLIQDLMTETFRRLLSAGVNSLVTPTGIKPLTVLFSMPLDTTPQLPFAVINLELVQQEETPIGQGIPQERIFAEAYAPSGTAEWTVSALQKRRYCIYIFTRTYQERDYFQEALMGVMYGMQATLSAINHNVRFGYQATQGAMEGELSLPGFYYSEVMVDLTHPALTQLSAQLGVVNAVTFTATSLSTGPSGTPAGSGIFVYD